VHDSNNLKPGYPPMTFKSPQAERLSGSRIEGSMSSWRVLVNGSSLPFPELRVRFLFICPTENKNILRCHKKVSEYVAELAPTSPAKP
jgi:hypothetical protein